MIQQFFHGESELARAGSKVAGQLRELPLPIRTLPDNPLVADKRTGSLVGFERAAEFQFAVGAHNGVWIDGQIDRKLPHSRKLIAGGQRSGRDAGPHLVDDLAVDGNSAAQVQPELESLEVGERASHMFHCTIILVQ